MKSGQFWKVASQSEAWSTGVAGILGGNPFTNGGIVSLSEAYKLSKNPTTIFTQWDYLGEVTFALSPEQIFSKHPVDESHYRKLRAEAGDSKYIPANSSSDIYSEAIEIKFKPHRLDVEPPKRGSDGAAGWDLCAAEDAVVCPFMVTLIPTGFDVEIPEGHFLFLVPRSGFAIKNHVIFPNSVGIIDEDYRGEMKVGLMLLHTNIHSPDGVVKINSDGVVRINKGDRICQAILMKYSQQTWSKVDELSGTKRGTQGFGSTGLR